MATGRVGSAGCGLWPSPSAAPLPSALSWSLPQLVPGLVVSCYWFQLAVGVGDTGSVGSAAQQPMGYVGLPGWLNPPCVAGAVPAAAQL